MEAGLSIYLENFATSLGSREQLAIAEFADALLVIPKTLAVNAAKVGREGWCGGCVGTCGESMGGSSVWPPPPWLKCDMGPQQ